VLKSSNPVLSNNNFGVEAYESLGAPLAGAGTRGAASDSGVMTVQGTVNKCFLLLTLCGGSAGAMWYAISSGAIAPMWGLLGGIVAALLGLVMYFAPRASPVLAPLYALFEGPMLASLSFLVANMIDQKIIAKGGTALGTGLIFQAVLLTFGIFGALLISYTLGLIRLSGFMQRCVVIGAAGVALAYIASFVCSLFGVQLGLTNIANAGPLSIGFSVVTVVIASLSLVMDFQRIEGMAESQAPKHAEWYAGFGLLTTLVWLYIEILYLLAKLRGRE